MKRMKPMNSPQGAIGFFRFLGLARTRGLLPAKLETEKDMRLAPHRNGRHSASSNNKPSVQPHLAGPAIDKDALQRYQDRLNHLACAVEGVALGYAPGVYCFGGPGTGKSHTVTKALKSVGEPGRHDSPQRGGLTAGGVLKLLERNAVDHNDQHIILDDAGDVIHDRRLKQYLLAALDHKGKRTITYTTHFEDRMIVFGKGLILLSNLSFPQHDDGVMRALQDRVQVLELDPPDDERAAMLLHLADTQPADGLTPTQRREAAEAVLELAQNLGVRPTLRDYFHRAIPFCRQDLDGNSRVHWRDRLRAAMTQTATVPERPTRAQTQADLRAQAAEIAAKYGKRADQLAAWAALGPGHSPASWYRHRPKKKPQAKHHDDVAEEIKAQPQAKHHDSVAEEMEAQLRILAHLG